MRDDDVFVALPGAGSCSLPPDPEWEDFPFARRQVPASADLTEPAPAPPLHPVQATLA